MRIPNKVIYNTLLDLQVEIEAIADELEELKAEMTSAKVSDTPKRGRGRPKKVA